MLMKSKVLLGMMETVGLGFLGLDRLYMGCGWTALAKLSSFVIAILLCYMFPTVGLVYALFHFLWTVFDFVLVAVNAATRSPFNPFCRSTVAWDTDVAIAQYFTPIALVIDVFFLGWYYPASPCFFFD